MLQVRSAEREICALERDVEERKIDLTTARKKLAAARTIARNEAESRRWAKEDERRAEVDAEEDERARRIREARTFLLGLPGLWTEKSTVFARAAERGIAARDLVTAASEIGLRETARPRAGTASLPTAERFVGLPGFSMMDCGPVVVPVLPAA